MSLHLPYFLRLRKSLAKLSVALLLFSILTLTMQSTVNPSPIWLKDGVYAKYRFKSGGLFFLNDTFINFPHQAQATFRWECVSVNGSVAELNVTITFMGKEREVRLSTLVHVNVENRDVTLLNGTLIGKTYLWLPANPEEGQTVILAGKPPDEVVAKVSIGGSAKTPQGYQRVFDFDPTEVKVLNRSVLKHGIFDLDSGVMIQAGLRGEATLLALDIWDVGLKGTLEFSATNIDLGPREVWPDIVTALPIAVPLVVFGFTLIFLLRRRRKRRR